MVLIHLKNIPQLLLLLLLHLEVDEGGEESREVTGHVMSLFLKPGKESKKERERRKKVRKTQ